MLDSHFHLWQYEPIKDAWITDDMSVIQRDFMPSDYQRELLQNGVDGGIVVQAAESDAENDFLLQAAQSNSFIKGVVGWLDFMSSDMEDGVDKYASNNLMKGFRYMLQGQERRDLMLDKVFVENITKLSQYRFTYDLLILPDQLQYTYELAKKVGNQLFVIDHLAKPSIKSGNIDQWKNDIQRIATLPNVYCKVSGMVTEADWKNWKPDDFNRSLDTVTDAFGTNRLLFGSDWPVCLLATDYNGVKQIAKNYFSRFSTNEQAQIFGKNAQEVYHI